MIPPIISQKTKQQEADVCDAIRGEDYDNRCFLHFLVLNLIARQLICDFVL
jgi:hypothetical protein